MKKILILFLLFLIIPFKLKAATFIKVDEQGNYINDAEFKIHSLDGSIEYDVNKTTETVVYIERSPRPMSIKKMSAGDIVPNGQYYFSDGGEEDYNKLLNILGTEERQIVEGLKNYNNIDNFYRIQNQEYSSEYARVQATRGIYINKEDRCVDTFSPSPQFSNKDYSVKFMEAEQSEPCTKVGISVPVFLILEETKAPTGLKKEKAVIEYEYYITYYYDANNNLMGDPYVSYEALFLYKYDYSLDYSNVLDFARKQITSTNEDEIYFKNDCGEYYQHVFVEKTPTPTSGLKNYNATKMNDACLDMPVIIDHENGAVLTISSYVNNGGSTRAIKGSKIDYKVVVKNEGTGSSTNNVITSKIPEGFEYVEGSASDNGVYLESSNAVIWNVDVIEVETTKELTYKVSVSEDVDLDKVYISTATVMNDGSDEIISNETRVTLEGLVNPKTGEFNSIIVLFVLSVIGLIGYYLIDRKTIVKGL